MRRSCQRLAATTLILFGLAGPCSAPGQSTTADDVRFWVHPNQVGIHLEIYAPVPLSNVLSIACKQAKVTCTGLDLVGKHNLPQMVVEGNFPHIARQLLEGSDVNFEYAHGSGQTQPKLTILRRPPAGTMPAQVAETPASETASVKGSAAVARPETPSVEDTMPPLVSPTSVHETDLQEAVQTAGQTDRRTAAEMIYRGGYATEASPSEYLPFPGPDGQPIRANGEKPEFLPFPDQYGRPIPVTPAKPGSPFPVPGDQQPPK